VNFLPTVANKDVSSAIPQDPMNKPDYLARVLSAKLVCKQLLSLPTLGCYYLDIVRLIAIIILTTRDPLHTMFKEKAMDQDKISLLMKTSAAELAELEPSRWQETFKDIHPDELRLLSNSLIRLLKRQYAWRPT
jgi:hypothetical protein